MALENKLGLTSSADLAREEERISKKKAVELFENGVLDTLPAGKFTTLPISVLRIWSSQMRVLRPLPSRKGWAIFISTYFSMISSKVDCGILSMLASAASR